jgi:hypothetical protein
MTMRTWKSLESLIKRLKIPIGMIKLNIMHLFIEKFLIPNLKVYKIIISLI